MTEEFPDDHTELISPPTGKPQSSDAQGELTAAVDDLLDQLKHKFDAVSSEMSTKLDDMTRRLDELEASLTASADSESKREARSGSGTPAVGPGRMD